MRVDVPPTLRDEPTARTRSLPVPALRRLLTTCIAIASTALASDARAGTFADGFHNNFIDPAWWTVGATEGSTAIATNTRVELTQGAGGAAGLSFNVPISGDFTARLDYVLLDWPTDNKERLALGAVATPTQQLLIERVSDSSVGVGTEIYVTDFTGQGILGTPTTDVSGTLQLERSGDTVRGSYWTGTDWNVIGTYSVAGEGSVARGIGFAIFPGAPVTSGVRVAVDNFWLQGPNVPVPEPAMAVLLAVGLSALAMRKRSS